MPDFKLITLEISDELIVDELKLSGERPAALNRRRQALQARFDRSRTLLDQVSLAARLADAEHRVRLAEAEDHQFREWVVTRSLSGF